jgi:hypothetical protein
MTTGTEAATIRPLVMICLPLNNRGTGKTGEWIVSPLVEFNEELEPKPWQLILVPLECRLDIDVGARLRESTDTPSAPLLAEAVNNFVGRARTSRLSSVFSESSFCDNEMTFRNRYFPRFGGDSIPQ